MKILRRSFVLVLLAVTLTVSGAFATWVFSGGGIDGVTGWLTPSFGDFVFPNAVYITRAAVADENGATGRVVSYAGTLLRTASTLGSAVSSSVSPFVPTTALARSKLNSTTVISVTVTGTLLPIVQSLTVSPSLVVP